MSCETSHADEFPVREHKNLAALRLRQLKAGPWRTDCDGLLCGPDCWTRSRIGATPEADLELFKLLVQMPLPKRLSQPASSQRIRDRESRGMPL